MGCSHTGEHFPRVLGVRILAWSTCHDIGRRLGVGQERVKVTDGHDP